MSGGPQPTEYRLRSPGEGVYRVLLEDGRTGAAAQAFFTGENDVETVRLPPGDYLSAVTDVGRNAVAARERVVLANPARVVDLPRFADSAARPRTAPGRIPSSLDRRASLLPKDGRGAGSPRAPADERREGLRGPTVGDAYNLQTVPTGREAGGRLFDAALSEDAAPGSIGGWRAPAGLTASLRPADGTGGIAIDVEDGPGGRRTRLRLTIGIEGRPAIRVPLPLFRDGVSVEVTPVATDHGPDLRVEVSAREPRTQGLLAALGDLDPDEASSVVEWASGTARHAVETLAEKSDDLWAATVAALVLTRIGRLEEVADWTHNLTRLAPHIADAGVVAASATLGFRDGATSAVEREALDLLRRSRRTGAPTFAAGNSLLLELLGGMRAFAVEDRTRRAADGEYRRATRRSRSRVFRSPLMIWEQRGENLQQGRLRGGRYLSVAHGELVVVGGQPSLNLLQ